MLNGRWSKECPIQAGRYFWRSSSTKQYGIVLFAWSEAWAHGTHHKSSQLEPVSIARWGNAPPHRGTGENSSSPGWAYGGRLEEDVEFWSEQLATPPGFPDVSNERRDLSAEEIEGEQKRHQASEKKRQADERKRQAARKLAITEAVEKGTSLYECRECEALWTWSDLIKVRLRHCPHCGIDFVEGEEGRNCPDCNRPFTSLQEERDDGCPDCEEHEGEPNVRQIVKDGVPIRTEE